MVLPLAPNISRIFLPKVRKNTVSTRATAISAVVQLPRIFSASSFLPFPSMMDALGAPPILTRAAKAEMAMMIGNVTPTPVRALAPTPGRWPMYIRSTMLYKTLMIWAVMAGTASLNSSLPTLPEPRSISFASSEEPIKIQSFPSVKIRMSKNNRLINIYPNPKKVNNGTSANVSILL